LNTLPTHLVINAAIQKKFGVKFKVAKSAFLWGSVLPDLPFGLLGWGTYAYYRFILQQDTSGVMENVIHYSYFNNPWWLPHIISYIRQLPLSFTPSYSGAS